MMGEDPDDRYLLREVLENGLKNVELYEIDNDHRIQQALTTSIYDLIIIAYEFSSLTNLDVLREIRDKGIELPVIMMIDSNTDEITVEAIKEQVDDYVIKSSDHLQKLPAKIVKITERRRADCARYRSHRALQVLNECNHTIVHATTGSLILILIYWTLIAVESRYQEKK